MGVSRSTFYRCRKQAREREAKAAAMAARQAILAQLDWQLSELRASLDRMAEANAAMAAILN
jgi:transposase-like protein